MFSPPFWQEFCTFFPQVPYKGLLHYCGVCWWVRDGKVHSTRQTRHVEINGWWWMGIILALWGDGMSFWVWDLHTVWKNAANRNRVLLKQYHIKMVLLEKSMRGNRWGKTSWGLTTIYFPHYEKVMKLALSLQQKDVNTKDEKSTPRILTTVTQTNQQCRQRSRVCTLSLHHICGKCENVAHIKC